MTGGGSTVHLGDVGLADDFENAPTVAQAVDSFINETTQGPVYNLTASGTAFTDVTDDDGLFVVGNGILEMDASCVSGECTFTFQTNDEFIDALDIYDQWPGNQDLPFSQPFSIQHQWTVQWNYGE